MARRRKKRKEKRKKKSYSSSASGSDSDTASESSGFEEFNSDFDTANGVDSELSALKNLLRTNNLLKYERKIIKVLGINTLKKARDLKNSNLSSVGIGTTGRKKILKLFSHEDEDKDDSSSDSEDDSEDYSRRKRSSRKDKKYRKKKSRSSSRSRKKSKRRKSKSKSKYDF